MISCDKVLPEKGNVKIVVNFLKYLKTFQRTN